MSVTNQKNEGVNTVIAAVAGVVVGAGVAIAGAVALSDKKNRDKVEGVINKAKDKTNSFVKNVQSKVQGKKAEMDIKKAEVDEQLVVGKEKVKKTLSEAADSVSDLAQKAKKEINKR